MSRTVTWVHLSAELYKNRREAPSFVEADYMFQCALPSAAAPSLLSCKSVNLYLCRKPGYKHVTPQT